MKLSKRLEMVASFVENGSSLADIGTDHGYIPIALAKRDIIKKGLAMDVRKGPLERAKEHIAEYHLEDRIETRLSDGARMLQPGEADAVVIAGMGGELVIHILEGGRHLWDSVHQWVLSPQSDLFKVRRYLREHGFDITKETMLEEDGKYYTVMNVVRGDMEPASEAYDCYGACLIRDRHPILKEYLKKEEQQLEKILGQLAERGTESAENRAKELKQQLAWIREVRDAMR